VLVTLDFLAMGILALILMSVIIPWNAVPIKDGVNAIILVVSNIKKTSTGWLKKVHFFTFLGFGNLFF
jgi:hypothetical protein